MPLLRVKGHLNVVLGHFCNISYMNLQNIDQICHVIFGILCGIIEKVELSNILLHMEFKVTLKYGTPLGLDTSTCQILIKSVMQI